METVASIKAKGAEDLRKQKLRDEAILLKASIFAIDLFVEALAERLGNPNKAGIFNIGKPAPAAETDMQYKKCGKSIQSRIGTALRFRDAFGEAPPQYKKAKELLDKLDYGGDPKLTQEDKKTEFIYEFRNLMVDLTTGGLPDCKPYQRLLNLFMSNTKEDKYKFDYDAIAKPLMRHMEKIKSAKLKAEANEIAEMAMAITVLEAKKAMPLPPSGVPASSLGEPAPDITSSEIESELSAPPAAVGATPPARSPLTNADKMKIAGIAAQISRDPRTSARSLSIDQIRQMAENIYRKKTGKGRKTHRNAKAHRKSRKVRRM